MPLIGRAGATLGSLLGAHSGLEQLSQARDFVSPGHATRRRSAGGREAYSRRGPRSEPEAVTWFTTHDSDNDNDNDNDNDTDEASSSRGLRGLGLHERATQGSGQDSNSCGGQRPRSRVEEGAFEQ